MPRLVDIRSSSLRADLDKILRIESELLSFLPKDRVLLTGALAYIIKYGYPRLPRDLDHYIPTGDVSDYFDIFAKISSRFGRVLLVRNIESDVPTKRGIFLSARGVVNGETIRFDVITPELFVGGLPYSTVHVSELDIDAAVCNVHDGTFLHSKRMKLEEGSHISLLDLLDVWWFYGKTAVKEILSGLRVEVLEELLHGYYDVRRYVPEENMWALSELYEMCRGEIGARRKEASAGAGGR